MIQFVEWHFEVIFCFLINRKCDFFQADKKTIRAVKWNLSHFLRLDKRKIRLWWGRESDVLCGRQALGTHFLPIDQP